MFIYTNIKLLRKRNELENKLITDIDTLLALQNKYDIPVKYTNDFLEDFTDDILINIDEKYKNTEEYNFDLDLAFRLQRDIEHSIKTIKIINRNITKSSEEILSKLLSKAKPNIYDKLIIDTLSCDADTNPNYKLMNILYNLSNMSKR